MRMRLSYAKQLHTVAACSRCGFNSVSVQTPKIHTLPSPFADVLGATLAFDNPSADTQGKTFALTFILVELLLRNEPVLFQDADYSATYFCCEGAFDLDVSAPWLQSCLRYGLTRSQFCAGKRLASQLLRKTYSTA
jgi:hypothetical protein